GPAPRAPAELGEFAPRRRVPPDLGVGELRDPLRRVALLQPAPRLRAERLLLCGEREVHGQRPLGSPSTRSATMFRRISDVPASIVLPRLRSCSHCQKPSPSWSCGSGPSLSSASFPSRWFASDQCSFGSEASGPGAPVTM